MNILPKLRNDIQILPALIQGRQVLAVKDLLGLRDDVIALVPEMAALLPYFDGEHTIRDLQMAMMRQGGGRLVMPEEIERMVAEFDKLLLLQTQRYHEKKQQIKQAFLEREYRPPSHQGAYPENEGELRNALEKMITTETDHIPAVPGRIQALIAPHIDLNVGSSTYGKAYAAVRHLGGVFMSGERRRRMRGVSEVLQEQRRTCMNRSALVLPNFPPAWVRHLCMGKN